MWDATRMFFGPENGVELELSPREPARDPPGFGWAIDEAEKAAEDVPAPAKPGR